MSYDALLGRCENREIAWLIAETAVSGEFSDNAEKTVLDGIRLVRKNALEKRRNRLVARISVLSGATPDEAKAITEMVAEKQGIDEELKNLKDTNE